MRANRWGIAVVGVLIQVALGGVYAWSVFRTSLAGDLGWTISEVSRTFTISIVMFGVASFFGGLWLSRTGSQTVAITGGLLYGVGVVLAGRSDHGLWWLYLTYGVVGGIGLGLAYIVPVAVLVKWFPDRRGLITGIAVGGFGAGALVESAGGARLLQSVGVLPTFAYLGAAFLIVTMARGFFMRSYGLMLTAWLCQRLRPTVDRPHAACEWQRPGRASCDRRRHARFAAASAHRVAAQACSR